MDPPGQRDVLDQLAGKIAAIVEAGTLERLTATLVLGYQATAADYTEFHRRFHQVTRQLTALREQGLVKVNDTLPASMGAKASVSVEDGKPEVLCLEIRSELIAAGQPATLTARALTLFHEVTHTLADMDAAAAGFFLIRDFTYRDSWGHGYLPSQVGWRNADTYAEAAAIIAGEIEPVPERFLARGVVPVHRQVLRQRSPGIILGPALAWAAVKINRAWLCSYDFLGYALDMAGSISGMFRSFIGLADTTRPGLRTIEEQLYRLGLIAGERSASASTAYLKATYSDQDKATATAIYAYMTKLKSALENIRLTLADTGRYVTYDSVAKTLLLPAGSVCGSSSELGDLIAVTLIGVLDYDDTSGAVKDVLNRSKPAIFDVLCANDRAYEAEMVSKFVLPCFRGISSQAPPSAEQWTILRGILQVTSIAEVLTVKSGSFAADLAGKNTAAREYLQQTSLEVADGIKHAVQVLTQLSYQDLPKDQRRALIVQIMTALSELQQVSAALGGPKYDQQIQSIAACMPI